MYKNLQAELTRAGITETEMSNILGLSRVTFSKRMNTPDGWTLREMDVTRKTINEKLGTSYSLDYLFEKKELA